MIDNDKITNSQLSILIVLTAIGVGMFSIPRPVTETAGTDGWITVILGGLIALLDFYIISRLARRFPDDTLVEIAQKVLGRFLAIPILLIFWVYLLTIIAMTLRVFGEVVKMSLLTRTPIEVILISFLILALMLARGGIEPIVRFNEIAFPIIYLTIIFSFLAVIPRSDFSNILPIFRTEPEKLMLGAYQTTYAFGGFEFVLLIIPFIKKPEKMFKSAAIPAFAILITTYVLVVVLSLAKFGVDSVTRLIWPTLSLIRTIDIPGSFIEKLEGVIMMQWILFAFTTIAPFTYGSALIPAKLFGNREFKHFCSLIIPVLYIVSLIPDNVVQAYQYQDVIINYLGAPSVFGFPLLLLIVSHIRKMGVEKSD